MNFSLHLLKCKQKQNLPINPAGHFYFTKSLLMLIIILYYNQLMLMKIVIEKVSRELHS